MSEQGPTPQPKPKDDDEEKDQPDRSAEATAEAIEEMERLESAEPAQETMREQSDVGSSPFAGDEDSEEIDIDLAEVDIGEEVSDDGDDDSPFSGTEDTDDTSADRDSSEYDGTTHDSDYGVGGQGFNPDDVTQGIADVADGEFEETLNEGFARLAVVGLPDEFAHNGQVKQKDDLQDEFIEVFETFKLGHYGAEAADEYLDFQGGDIDPIWGFTAAMLVCTVLVVQMRPDGGELVGKAKGSLGGITENLR